MTRINTNVSSLVAQNTLQRSNQQLQESLTRLSTGLRINVGKDDPAGLIASEALRSDIVSVQKAVTNSERANQLIATADSALGQVSSLLNDIRGLVSEAANTGALSEDQIQANQLQIDSSLEAIDRIAQITSFQGKRLLDGNLDFITSGVSSDIQGLQIDQANFGTLDEIGVEVNVVKQATRAELNYSFGAISEATVLEVSGSNGTEAFQFADGTTIEEIASSVNLVSDATGVSAEIEKAAAEGSITASSFGADNDIQITANEAGLDEGNIRIKFSDSGGSATTQATLTAASGDDPATIEVQLATEQGATATGVADETGTENNALKIDAKIKSADFNGLDVEFADRAQNANATIEFFADGSTAYNTIDLNGGAGGVLAIEATQGGTSFNGVDVQSVADGNGTSGLEIRFDPNGGGASKGLLTIDLGGSTAETLASVRDAINASGFNFKAFVADDGTSAAGDAADQATGPVTLANAVDGPALRFNIEAGTTTADDVVADLTTNTDAATKRVAGLFTIANAPDNDGTGAIGAATLTDVLSGGVDKGAITATANDVITAINDKVNGAGNSVTAALAAGNDGHALATKFEEFAFVGQDNKNNRLQFLSPSGGPNIRFTSTAGSSLGLDLTTDPRTEGFSSTTIQSDSANGSLVFTARQTGTEFDGFTVVFDDSDGDVAAGTNEYAVLNRETKELRIFIDGGNSTAADVAAAVNNDSYVSQFFRATDFGDSDGTGTLVATDTDNEAKTSGGLASVGTLIVNLETDADGLIKTTANDLISFFDDPSQFVTDSTELTATQNLLAEYGISVSNAEGSNGSGLLEATSEDAVFATSGTQLEDQNAEATTNAVNGVNTQLKFAAKQAGEALDGVTISFVNNGTISKGNETGAFDATAKTLVFQIEEGQTTADDIRNIFLDNGSGIFDAELADLFTVTNVGDGSGVINTSDTGTTSGGVKDVGTQDGAALLGNSDLANKGLTLRSSEFGSDQFVSLKALSGSFEVTDSTGAVASRASGTDVVARINGIEAVGRGRKASVNTSSLDVSFTVAQTVNDGSTLSFKITGGGASFQLGPDVVSNQQARLGIQSVSTATLGGVSGRLFELRSGGAKALNVDASGAASVVDEVIGVVTKLRGRLGAFQRTTLETNIFTLNDTLANLTDAESSIRDADFAAESAKLTRAQILVQSGTSVLGIANSNPQNALALLR